MMCPHRKVTDKSLFCDIDYRGNTIQTSLSAFDSIDVTRRMIGMQEWKEDDHSGHP